MKSSLIVLLLFLSIPLVAFSNPTIDPDENTTQETQEGLYIDTASALEREAILYTKNGQGDKAVASLEAYIVKTGDFSILENSAYEALKRNNGFIELKDKYLVKFSMGTFFYLYVGLIGIFIALILNARKKQDKMANGLISLFVFMHSFFLIHVALYLSNYVYYEPHTLSMSAPFSFLYGPVLYFYFKRITKNYEFKKTDALHLIPTVIFLILLIPVFAMSAEGKLEIMLGEGSYSTLPYLVPATICKVISLVVYGFFTIKLYLNNKQAANVEIKQLRLRRNIVVVHSVYAVFYALYAFILIQYSFGSDLLHIQLLAMTGLVLYVGYVAYSNPQALIGTTVVKVKKAVNKYQNSGLTPSFSNELKEQLVKLLEEDKLYRQSTLKLEYVAERLGTTRHNASQVINEHFGLNFFELINKYRVEEAMERLKNNPENLNIIDIAYEVGYNNKVTFNKSFKRFCDLTPTQFLKLENVS